MNSMMLIAGQYYAARLGSSLAFDAFAAMRSDHGGMHCSGRQHHPIPRVQDKLLALAFEHERDGSVDAVQYLLIRVAVRRVAIAGPVRPRVAAGRLAIQSLHQLF